MPHTVSSGRHFEKFCDALWTPQAAAGSGLICSECPEFSGLRLAHLQHIPAPAKGADRPGAVLTYKYIRIFAGLSA